MINLYRAKTLTGNWKYGYPVTVPNLPIVIVPDQPVTVTYRSFIFSDNWEDYKTLTQLKFDDPNFPKFEVNPDTIQRNIDNVGANSVPLYEGDIITANIYPFENFNAIIIWIEEYKSYMMQYKKKKGVVVRGIFDGMVRELQYLQNANIDVVGNIVDNPDLIQ